MTSNQQPGRDRNRIQAVAMIAVFDIAGPLVAYSLLRSAGLSTVSALVLSGIFPAFGVLAGLIRHRRFDVLGFPRWRHCRTPWGCSAATLASSWWRARCPPRCSARCAWVHCGPGAR